MGNDQKSGWPLLSYLTKLYVKQRQYKVCQSVTSAFFSLFERVTFFCKIETFFGKQNESYFSNKTVFNVV